MWPFGPSRLPEDDHRRLNRVVEDVESLSRRVSALVQDVEEFYAKVNKARQRVVKEERDASARVAGGEVAGAGVVGPLPVTKDELRARLRARRRGE